MPMTEARPTETEATNVNLVSKKRANYDIEISRRGFPVTRAMLTSLVLFGALCGPTLAGTIYVDVDATGTGDGLSWANAKTTVTAGVTAATSGDEVWVAEGSYYNTVTLKDGVAIIGGFNGTETASSQADPLANPTDLNGSGNSRVVEGTDNAATAELRGFNIIRGFVDCPEYGAGMELTDSDATISDCVFTQNEAGALGGALCNFGGSPTFTNCRFVGNDGQWAGGAIVNRFLGSPSFVNCLFAQNTAWEGGAVESLSGSPSFTNCTFFGNSASKGKGGVAFDVTGGAVFENCIVWSNTAHVAGTEEFYNPTGAAGTTTALYSVIQDDDPNDANIYAGTGNIDDDPALTVTESGTWSENAVLFAGFTTFEVATSTWTADELAGLLINPDTSGVAIAFIQSNTSTEIVVFGGFTSVLASDSFDIIDPHLGSSSPCIDTGDPAGVTATTDLEGNAREVQGLPGTCDVVLDMGALEFTAVDCCEDPDCSAPTPLCDTSTSTCVQCFTNGDCSAPTPKCKTSISTCVQCLTGGDCGPGEDCVGNFCQGGEEG